MRGYARLSVVVAAGMLALATLASPPLGGQEAGSVLRYGMTEGVIESAHANDARAASLLWAQGIADAIGLYRGAEATVYQTAAAAASAVNAGHSDLLAISTLEYLQVEHDLRATPAMVWETSKTVTVDFVLVARASADGLSGAAGKTLALFAASRPWALSEAWADVMLADAGVPKGQKAFATVKIVEKKGQAAMAVFFGQADYAVESRSAFEAAAELNPQLGRELTVLARSPAFVPGMVCLSDRMGRDLQRRYVEKATRLHELPRYRQAFMVMRVTRLAEWDPRYLDSARALLVRQRALQARRSGG